MAYTFKEREQIREDVIKLCIASDESLLDTYINNNLEDVITFDEFCNIIQYESGNIDPSLIKDNTDVQCGVRIGTVYFTT
ncbi:MULTISPECIES: hypothetical protein [Anaerococcus]|uniref:hypothetical protein n=1 Tax=Anaerococcus TaxID=165779 RepID=UPI002431207B|nr:MULTISPECIES: hypothetical protein [Anaerococcus]MDD7767090.1 hypothetical protein [Anaerococcus vaginalis]MDY6127367.1 hypothetical protein [Anaerococcus sp.]